VCGSSGEALGSIPSTAKKKERKEGGREIDRRESRNICNPSCSGGEGGRIMV
jgi:hypothetical protein